MLYDMIYVELKPLVSIFMFEDYKIHFDFILLTNSCFFHLNFRMTSENPDPFESIRGWLNFQQKHIILDLPEQEV